MAVLDRKIVIKCKPEFRFSIVELTISEYESLPDYSVAYPTNREIGDMGKVPDLSFPGEYLIDIKISENVGQIVYCEFI